MNKICFMTLAMASVLLVSNSVASETPIKSLTESKGSLEACKDYVKNEAKKANKNFQCRSLLDVVFICDNNSFHIEYSCNDGDATMDVFAQDESDWKRFYR